MEEIGDELDENGLKKENPRIMEISHQCVYPVDRPAARSTGLGVHKKSVDPAIRSDPIRSADFDPIRRLTDRWRIENCAIRWQRIDGGFHL